MCYEREQYHGYQIKLHDYRNDLDAYRKARDEAIRKDGGHKAVKAALNALALPVLEPLSPILIIEEPTYEGLIKQLASGRPSIGLFSDEGGRMIGGYGMSKDHQLKTAAGLSNLWDGKPVTRSRSEDGSMILFGRRVSLHLMVQPAVAALMLGNQMLRDQGLLSRCLVVLPTSTAGTRSYKNVDLSLDPTVKSYNSCIRGILERELPLAEGMRNTLALRKIQLTSSAKTTWVSYHDHVEKQLGEGAPYTRIRGFASKAPEHAVRLAGVLSLIDDIESQEITQIQIEAGVILTEFYLAESLRLADVAIDHPDLILAERLLRWLQKLEYVYLSQIYQKSPIREIRNKNNAMRIMSILEQHGWLRRISGGKTLDGANHRDVWEIVKPKTSASVVTD